MLSTFCDLCMWYYLTALVALPAALLIPVIATSYLVVFGIGFACCLPFGTTRNPKLETRN